MQEKTLSLEEENTKLKAQLDEALKEIEKNKKEILEAMDIKKEIEKIKINDQKLAKQANEIEEDFDFFKDRKKFRERINYKEKKIEQMSDTIKELCKNPINFNYESQRRTIMRLEKKVFDLEDKLRKSGERKSLKHGKKDMKKEEEKKFREERDKREEDIELSYMNQIEQLIKKIQSLEEEIESLKKKLVLKNEKESLISFACEEELRDMIKKQNAEIDSLNEKLEIAEKEKESLRVTIRETKTRLLSAEIVKRVPNNPRYIEEERGRGSRSKERKANKKSNASPSPNRMRRSATPQAPRTGTSSLSNSMITPLKNKDDINKIPKTSISKEKRQRSLSKTLGDRKLSYNLKKKKSQSKSPSKKVPDQNNETSDKNNLAREKSPRKGTPSRSKSRNSNKEKKEKISEIEKLQMSERHGFITSQIGTNENVGVGKYEPDSFYKSSYKRKIIPNFGYTPRFETPLNNFLF